MTGPGQGSFQRRKRAVGIRALTPSTSFTPTQGADLYAFPPDADGTGQCIALIELGAATKVET